MASSLADAAVADAAAADATMSDATVADAALADAAVADEILQIEKRSPCVPSARKRSCQASRATLCSVLAACRVMFAFLRKLPYAFGESAA
jgi:hypothetical protein